MTDVDPIGMNSDDVKTVRDGVTVIVDYMDQIADMQEAITAALDAVNQKTGLDKKMIRKLAKTKFKRSFSDEQNTHSDFEDMYTRVFGSN